MTSVLSLASAPPYVSAHRNLLNFSTPRRGSGARETGVRTSLSVGVFCFQMITKERLDEVLDYNQETGLFTWRVRPNRSIRIGTVAGSPISTSGHISVGFDGKRYLAHRLAFLTMTGCWPEHEVDHINGDPADNRWSNLRPATRAENARNVRKKSNNTSGVPGVYWAAARGKWMAYIHINRKMISLGRFTEFQEAAAARRAAEVKYFGEFSATASRK